MLTLYNMGINNKLTLRLTLCKRLRKLRKRLHKLHFMIKMITLKCLF
ncbi:MAG: hypothetical protein JWR05_810 [Mucilaginibacter sp.]|nr:hypothetical protein [Mucilaginibacter sp.]